MPGSVTPSCRCSGSAARLASRCSSGVSIPSGDAWISFGISTCSAAPSSEDPPEPTEVASGEAAATAAASLFPPPTLRGVQGLELALATGAAGVVGPVGPVHVPLGVEPLEQAIARAREVLGQLRSLHELDGLASQPAEHVQLRHERAAHVRRQQLDAQQALAAHLGAGRTQRRQARVQLRGGGGAAPLPREREHEGGQVARAALALLYLVELERVPQVHQRAKLRRADLRTTERRRRAAARCEDRVLPLRLRRLEQRLDAHERRRRRLPHLVGGAQPLARARHLLERRRRRQRARCVHLVVAAATAAITDRRRRRGRIHGHRAGVVRATRAVGPRALRRHRARVGGGGEARAEVLLGLQCGQRGGRRGQPRRIEAIARREEAGHALCVGATEERGREAGQPAAGQRPPEGKAEEVEERGAARLRDLEELRRLARARHLALQRGVKPSLAAKRIARSTRRGSSRSTLTHQTTCSTRSSSAAAADAAVPAARAGLAAASSLRGEVLLVARSDDLGEDLRGGAAARVGRAEDAVAQVGEPAVVVEEPPAHRLRRGVRAERLRVRRRGHLDEQRSDGEVTPQRILLRRAAHVARGHAVGVVVDLLADGRHEVDLDPDHRLAHAEVGLGRVDVLLLARVREDVHHLDRRDVEIGPAAGEGLHELHDADERHVGRALAQAQAQVEVVGRLAKQQVAHIAAVHEQLRRQALAAEVQEAEAEAEAAAKAKAGTRATAEAAAEAEGERGRRRGRGRRRRRGW
eukprot:scaffold97252_cov64-Phaeocystis_antarctica.AAC.5